MGHLAKVIITKGLPASGKSTFAHDYVTTHKGKAKNVCKDDLRAMLDFNHHTGENEKLVLKLRDQIIISCLRRGFDVIVSDTNLHPKHERHIRALVGSWAEVEVLHFDTSADECIERDSHREGHTHVGETVIRKMAKDWETWQHMDTSVVSHELEHVSWIEGARHALMCDIDGTLAHNDGHRSFFEWHKVGNDSINQEIAGLLALYKEAGYAVILMSGRDEVCRKETEAWCEYYGVLYDSLYMRPEKDGRKDDIVKAELFDKYVRGNYNIHFVLDDRPQVIRMWKSIGLTVFNVGDDIEF